jgi:transposase
VMVFCQWGRLSSRAPSGHWWFSLHPAHFSNLRLWFKAVAYMAVTRCGISSRQLSRDLGVGVKTGWRMFHQIRKALAEDEGVLEGDVEVDETYIGGKRPGKRGRGAEGKTIVMGMVERSKPRLCPT